jgi:hypothetical protein
MAESPPPASGGGLEATPAEALGTFKIVTTRPSEIRRHDISDEELEMLADTKHDHLTECMWAAIGGAVSSFPGAFADVYAAYFVENAPGLSGFALFEVTIFVVSFTAAVCLTVIASVRGKKAGHLVERIKARGPC